MYSKSQIEILAFLDNYLKETSAENVQKDIQEISMLKFKGTSAKEYFTNFHKYYQNEILNIPETKISVVISFYSLSTLDKPFRKELYRHNTNSLSNVFHGKQMQETISYLKPNILPEYNNYKEEIEIHSFN